MSSNLTLSATLTAALMITVSAAQADARLVPDPPKTCKQCDAWSIPLEPFRVFGNTYYVGTKELSAVLIADEGGLILLDAGIPQAAPLIDANIKELGFKTADIKLIVNSHTHFDHAGGIAALQRATGAAVAASQRSAEALRAGRPNADDPQFAETGNDFPRVQDARVIRDGETLTVGKVHITASFTPGHTPGGTTWTWQSCEGSRCFNVVYADSLNAVSAEGFRFTGSASRTSNVETFQQSIRKVAILPCDILLSPHPGLFGMQDKLQRKNAGQNDAFVDPNACRAYAGAARALLEKRIGQERTALSRP